jgi:hypothetical protein
VLALPADKIPNSRNLAKATTIPQKRQQGTRAK